MCCRSGCCIYRIESQASDPIQHPGLTCSPGTEGRRNRIKTAALATEATKPEGRSAQGVKGVRFFVKGVRFFVKGVRFFVNGVRFLMR